MPDRTECRRISTGSQGRLAGQVTPPNEPRGRSGEGRSYPDEDDDGHHVQALHWEGRAVVERADVLKPFGPLQEGAELSEYQPDDEQSPAQRDC